MRGQVIYSQYRSGMQPYTLWIISSSNTQGGGRSGYSEVPTSPLFMSGEAELLQ
jgi:hypothetical protein